MGTERRVIRVSSGSDPNRGEVQVCHALVEAGGFMLSVRVPEREGFGCVVRGAG